MGGMTSFISSSYKPALKNINPSLGQCASSDFSKEIKYWTTLCDTSIFSVSVWMICFWSQSCNTQQPQSPQTGVLLDKIELRGSRSISVTDRHSDLWYQTRIGPTWNLCKTQFRHRGFSLHCFPIPDFVSWISSPRDGTVEGHTRSQQILFSINLYCCKEHL